MKLAFVLFSFFIATNSFSQDQYAKVDAFVESVGSLPTLNVATIADTLTNVFPDKASKARAIYYWITHNIQLDVKAVKGNNNKNVDPVTVIATRKATALGYSILYQEMSSLANIRCLTVDGYIKYSADDINNPVDEINHSWNVVQLGQSPEDWFYVDAARGSGYADRKLSVFTPSFTIGYFFADKTLFNLDHFPDNNAWQLGGGPKSIKEFYSLPVIYNAAYDYNISNMFPKSGFAKAKTGKPFTFSFDTQNSEIKEILLMIGAENKKQEKTAPMNFSNSGGKISFSYQFKKDDTYPVKLIVDGKPLLEYMIEVSE